MTSETIAMTLAALAVLCGLVGVRGIWRGQDVASERGRDTLMHYPVPLPWLRQKVTAARWVVWIGRLYLLAGIACMTGAWIVWTAQHRTSPPIQETCSAIAQRVQYIHVQTLRGGSIQTTVESEGCVSTILDAKGVRWFVIRSTPPDRLIGQGFNHSRAQLERRGFTISSIDGVGNRAALATPRPKSGLNPVVLFDDTQGHHHIEMNARTLNETVQNQLIAGLRESPRQKSNE